MKDDRRGLAHYHLSNSLRLLTCERMLSETCIPSLQCKLGIHVLQCKLGIRMCIMCLTRSTWKVRNGEARSAVEMMLCCPPPIPLHGSASKVNSLSADTQVISRHCYFVVFHPFVEQLTVFHTSGLILASSSVLRVLELDLHRDGIVSSMCQTGT